MSSMTYRVDQRSVPSCAVNLSVFGLAATITCEPFARLAAICSARPRHASQFQLVGVTSTGWPAVSFSQPLDRMRRFTTGVAWAPTVLSSGSAASLPRMMTMLGSFAIYSSSSCSSSVRYGSSFCTAHGVASAAPQPT